jgi:hypothetical protein
LHGSAPLTTHTYHVLSRVLLQTYHGIDELRPDNLYLVCGDPNLEDIVGELHTSSSHNDKSFSRVHNYLKTFIEVLKARPGWDKQGLTVFIDTNPALTMYTRLALCAARKLVMVVMADDFSREALRYVTWQSWHPFKWYCTSLEAAPSKNAKVTRVWVFTRIISVFLNCVCRKRLARGIASVMAVNGTAVCLFHKIWPP